MQPVDRGAVMAAMSIRQEGEFSRRTVWRRESRRSKRRSRRQILAGRRRQQKLAGWGGLPLAGIIFVRHFGKARNHRALFSTRETGCWLSANPRADPQYFAEGMGPFFLFFLPGRCLGCTVSSYSIISRSSAVSIFRLRDESFFRRDLHFIRLSSSFFVRVIQFQPRHCIEKLV